MKNKQILKKKDIQDGREVHISSGITALLWRRSLRNSMKLWAMPCRVTQDRWVRMKNSEKMWSRGGENGKPRQYSYVSEKPKRYDTGRWVPRSEGIQYATAEQRRNSSRNNEEAGPKCKWRLVMNMSGGESKVWCCKEQYCIGTWDVRSMNQGKSDTVSRRWQEWTSTF